MYQICPYLWLFDLILEWWPALIIDMQRINAVSPIVLTVKYWMFEQQISQDLQLEY